MDKKDLPVWFPPSRILFLKLQMTEFILPNYGNMEYDGYPPEPDEYLTWWFGRGWYATAASLHDRKHMLKPYGYQVPAAEILAEVDTRLDLIKWRYKRKLYTGKLLIDFYCYGKVIIDDRLLREIDKMMVFISGWRRPRVDYITWKKLRRKTDNASLSTLEASPSA